MRKKFEKHLTALQGHSSSPVDMFFCKYWVLDFAYNPSAHQWKIRSVAADGAVGDTKLEDAIKEFQAAAESNAAPIAAFLRGREIPGYSYGSERVELEFKKPAEAHRSVWEQEGDKMGRDVKGGGGEKVEGVS